MAGDPLPEEHLSFGPYSLDARQRVLLRGDVPLRLTPREIDVLITLVAAHGEIVDKSRFFDQVWRGVSVEECNLSQHVAALRRVLGDDARVPIYIETVPRRGHRFVEPVEAALLSGEGRVRLAAELIDARSQRLIWAEMFECDEVSVFETDQRIHVSLALERVDSRTIHGEPTGRLADESVRGEAEFPERTVNEA